MSGTATSPYYTPTTITNDSWMVVTTASWPAPSRVPVQPAAAYADTPLGKAVALLDAFGDPERIRLHLRGTGILGMIADSSECMIARYLRDAAASDRPINVSASFVQLGDIHDPTAERYALPVSVTAFIRQFDRGAYPELIDPASRKPCPCFLCAPQLVAS